MSDQRPEVVRKALLILWGTIVLGIIRIIFEFQFLVKMSASMGGVTFVCIVQVFTFLFLGGLFWAIGNGKNWARWLYVFLFVIGLPFSIVALIYSLSETPVSGVIGIIQTIAQIVVVVLLFQAPARKWFTKSIEA